MYQSIFNALQVLSKGDKADLKRCNLQTLATSPSYFRVLAYSKASDNKQTQRVLYLLLHSSIEEGSESQSVAQALMAAGVKEQQIIQITRSGDNGIDYLKRQLVRCKHINLDSLGRLATYWGDKERRRLLKEFILATTEKYDSESDTELTG